MADRIGGLGALSKDYRAIFCDVWGVLHNGQSPYPDAAAALARFRSEGGRVVLITNSPRPHAGVEKQLDEIGVSANAYDAIATSGDVTRSLISRAEGPLFHLGPKRDHPLFDGLDVALSSFEDANGIVCTGLNNDEQEEPEDYRATLAQGVERGLPFICANPDIVVERGDRLIWCAGALAKLYEELGGQIRIAGKPHAPIYDLALELLAEAGGKEIGKSEILAIGDGMPTDVKGAQDNGFDLLYIAAGIHAGEYGGSAVPDPAALNRFLTRNGATPVAWMPRLTWTDGSQA